MKPILLLLILSLVTIANAQETKISNKKLGLSFTPIGENDVSQFNVLDGAGATHGEGYFSIGISFQKPLTKTWLKFETGLDYSHHKIKSVPAFNPNIAQSPTFSNFSLVTIPVTMKAEFLRFFFIEGGGIVNIYTGPNAPVSNQAGLGINIGYGLQYELKSRWTFAVNHYARMHSVVAFMGAGSQQHVWEKGLKFGIYVPLSVLRK